MVNYYTIKPEEPERRKISLILELAADLLCEKGWCQGAMARTTDKTPISTTAKEAACFCAFGAITCIVKGGPGSEMDSRIPARKAALIAFCNDAFSSREFGVGTFTTSFNDTVADTRDEVVAALRNCSEKIRAVEELDPEQAYEGELKYTIQRYQDYLKGE